MRSASIHQVGAKTPIGHYT